MLTESPLNGVRKIRSRAFRLNPRTRRRYSPPRRACQTTRTATRIVNPMATSQTARGVWALSSGP
ncbi:MAG: hypothetical protein AUH20_05270 [Candidatus Rokubacteria bacterium 13_2_20CM_69_15_2]|nr:MAG: hypothetical protein AUH20_05270 [Candidatus Rokubacteria bacterium 13_2_20CM_69_15_2]